MATKYKLAELAELDKSTLHRIFSGEIAEPSVKKCFQIEDAIRKLDHIELTKDQFKAMFSAAVPGDVYNEILSNSTAHIDFKKKFSGKEIAELNAFIHEQKQRIAQLEDEVIALRLAVKKMLQVKNTS